MDGSFWLPRNSGASDDFQLDGTVFGFRRNVTHFEKTRSDDTIKDEAIQTQCLHRIRDLLIPEIFKADQFRATRMERYIVACYASTKSRHLKCSS